MKHIYEYILNKDTKIVKLFPCTPKISDYIYFFEFNNFKKIKNNPNKDNYEYTMDKFRNCLDKCYMIGEQKGPIWIRFKNKGKITNKNPLFFIFVNENGDEERYRAANTDNVIGFIDDDTQISIFEDYIDFINYAKMIFNYK